MRVRSEGLPATVGIGVSISIGIELAVLSAPGWASSVASARAAAPTPPPAKQVFLDRSAADWARIQAGARAAVGSTPAPYVRQPVDVSGTPQGIFELRPGRAPFSAMDVRLTTLFQRVVGSTIWQVYAGSRMRDPQQGVIIVHTQDPNAPGSLAGTSSVLTYDAPR